MPTGGVSVDEEEAAPAEPEPEVLSEFESAEVEAEAPSVLEEEEEPAFESTAEAPGSEVAEEEESETIVAEEAPAAPSGGRSIRGAEGARLIALNMALNGTPRDETAAYLSQNFELDDQDALLDEVYARVGS